MLLAGRPIKVMDPSIQTAFLATWNNFVLAHEVGRCSQIQYFFQLDCLCHFTYRTPKNITHLRKDPEKTGLECRICHYLKGELQGRPVSKHEAYAWAILHSLLKCRILVEIKVLGEKYGAADIWLPISPRGLRIDLVLMIDGEHHFKTKWDEIEHQMAVDKAFDDECWRQEHRLVRLCSDDKHEWADCIDLAVTKAELEPDKKFQLFSSQYATRTAQVNREAIMNDRHNRETGAYFERL